MLITSWSLRAERNYEIIKISYGRGDLIRLLCSFFFFSIFLGLG